MRGHILLLFFLVPNRALSLLIGELKTTDI